MTDEKLKTIEWVYRELLAPKDMKPLPPMSELDAREDAVESFIELWEAEHGRWGGLIRTVIVQELDRRGETATLLGTGGKQVSLPTHLLFKIDPHSLSLGVFGAQFYLQDAWLSWDGATVQIPTSTAKSVIREVTAARQTALKPKGGRPFKVSPETIWAEYVREFPSGHRAAGVSWKDAYRACPSAAGVSQRKFQRDVNKFKTQLPPQNV